MPKVLIADTINDRALDIFKHHKIETFMPHEHLSMAELLEIIGDYDALVIRSQSKVTRELIEHAPKLKVIGRAGIGVDNIDIAAATEKGILVMHTPFGNAITTAEHAIALLLSLARNIPQANQSTKQSQWKKSHFIGCEITGKTLGILGCGNIGTVVSDRARGLKMSVIAYDPFLSPERANELDVEKVELNELYHRADFITLHTPLTAATKHMINKDSLAKMKKGVHIINCARGDLVAEDDLYQALKSGHIGGAALDVFNTEPAINNPLFSLDNVICTPHLGASTNEAQENVALQIAEQVSRHLVFGAVENALNMNALSSEEAPKLRPYFELAKQLGSFVGQITHQAVLKLKIEYQGAVGGLNTKLLTAIILEAILKPVVESVNMVSAPQMARERNIKVIETHDTQTKEYHTLIRLTVCTDIERTIAGTLFGGDKPRIVEIEGIPIEAELGRHMLYITNQDKPGFIGALGSLLGKYQVNIATFHLGRVAQGKDAILLMQVDEPIPPDIITQVRALPQVVFASILNF